VAQALEFFFDEPADAAVRALWQRLELAGVPSLLSHTHRRHRPHVTFALGGSVSPAARAELREDLARLSLPNVWLYTLGTFPTADNGLFLGAVADAELLAVHRTVHDALVGRVRDPWAYYLPGAWVPHCSLAQGITANQLATGFATVHPAQPIRAAIAEVGITDTRTGDVDLLWRR
jgi:2'-5' RNA ligase